VANAKASVREAVLALRDDPMASSLMAGALARDNAAGLEVQLGRAPSGGEVHLAHVLGLGGAGRFLAALARDPDAAAADVVPRAAAANGPIFYERGGGARSLADVMALIAGKVDGADALAASRVSRASHIEPAPMVDRSLQARTAYLLLAELGG
jgi:hypothetical protein